MTSEMKRHLTATACGSAGAVLFALGFALMVIWSVDSASSNAGLPQLLGGAACIALGAICVAARRRLVLDALPPNSQTYNCS